MKNKWIYNALFALNCITISTSVSAIHLHESESLEVPTERLPQNSTQGVLKRGYATSRIITIFKNMPMTEQELFIGHVVSLTNPGTGIYERCQMSESLAAVLVHDRKSVVKHVRLLRSLDMNGDDVCTLISALATVPSRGRASFVKDMKSATRFDRNGYQVSLLASALAKVAARDRPDFMEHIKSLNDFVIDDDKFNVIVHALAAAPAIDRTDIIELFTSVIHSDIDGNDLRRLIEDMSAQKPAHASANKCNLTTVPVGQTQPLTNLELQKSESLPPKKRQRKD